MAHVSKAKAKGISASSFFDLKAELAKQEEEFAKNKAAGKSTYIVGGVKRSDKKPTVWLRQNKGIKSRAQRDLELEAIDKPTLESARAALERKAKIYEKLRKGKTGGLSEKQYDSLLVDFDSTPVPEFYESDEDVDESLNVPRPPSNEEDDPIVEYEDEFGRVRTARRSEVPRNLLPTEDQEPDEDEDIIIRNPVNHFPIYEPSAERIAEIAREHAEEANPLNIHYDASKEVRAKGAAFYQFSADEETRRAQMEELKQAREETSKVRQETGAIDVRPGEVEGMRSGGIGDGKTQSRAIEKRKRELEERKKMIEAKRRKVQGNGGEASGLPQEAQPEPSTSSGTPAPPADPFAAIKAKSKIKAKPPSTPKPVVANEADAFLAVLEKDLLATRNKGKGKQS